MARIRTIKPEFFTSEDIVARSPMARLLYIALWCEADKEGRLVWKPATFKLRYLPGDNCDVHALCAELVDAGLVVLYGEGFAHIPTFNAHQHINPRESVSQLPEPTRQSRVGTRQARVGDAQGGREGKGKEGKEEKAPAAPSLSFGELESEGLTRETAVEFLALRNRKRARLTRKAWDGIKAEIDKAGWTPERAILKAISRGWTAFEAAWVAEAVKPADIARTTVPADPASFNRTKEAPLTAEEKAAAEEVRKRLFPIKRIAA
jgi:hypothetical protein